MNPIKDRTGQRYGRLTVIGIAGRNSRGKILWRCKCDCGNEILRESGTLKPGRECSCGCARAEIGVKNNLKAQKKTCNHRMSICWDCIRSAAPPSLQCLNDKTKGARLPEGVDYTLNVTSEYVRTLVISCPEFLSIHDKDNAELLEQERKKYTEQKLEESRQKMNNGMKRARL